jgi:putative Mn2+ efflux pump MntP
LSIIEVLFIAFGLSADAFAVSLGNGLSMEKARGRDALAIAFAFGLFQALMPVLGFGLGAIVAGYIEKFDHILALILLGYIGGRMIWEGVRKGGEKAGEEAAAQGVTEKKGRRKSALGGLLMQAVATSIDALVVGVSFAAMGLSWARMAGSAAIIGTTTFLLSFVGVFLGKKFGGFLGSKAEIAGGVVLIGIGVKVFVEHTFFGA